MLNGTALPRLTLVAALHAISLPARSARAQGTESTPSPSHASSEALSIAPSTVWVHVQAPNGTILLRSNGKEWVSVCSAPCDVAVPARDFYRLVGENFVTTDAFALQAPGGARERIEGHAASNAKHTVGVVLVVGGAVALYVGFPIFFLTYGLGPGDALYSFGLATMLTFGFGFLCSSSRSTVSQYVIGRGPLMLDWRREWMRMAEAHERWAPPAPIGIPIFTGTFE